MISSGNIVRRNNSLSFLDMPSLSLVGRFLNHLKGKSIHRGYISQVNLDRRSRYYMNWHHSPIIADSRGTSVIL